MLTPTPRLLLTYRTLFSYFSRTSVALLDTGARSADLTRSRHEARGGRRGTEGRERGFPSRCARWDTRMEQGRARGSTPPTRKVTLFLFWRWVRVCARIVPCSCTHHPSRTLIRFIRSLGCIQMRSLPQCVPTGYVAQARLCRPQRHFSVPCVPRGALLHGLLVAARRGLRRRHQV